MGCGTPHDAVRRVATIGTAQGLQRERNGGGRCNSQSLVPQHEAFAFQEEPARFRRGFHPSGEKFEYGQQCGLDRGDCRVSGARGTKCLSPLIEIEQPCTPRQELCWKLGDDGVR